MFASGTWLPNLMPLFSFASWPEFVKDALMTCISCEALLRGQVGTAHDHIRGILLGLGFHLYLEQNSNSAFGCMRPFRLWSLAPVSWPPSVLSPSFLLHHHVSPPTCQPHACLRPLCWLSLQPRCSFPSGVSSSISSSQKHLGPFCAK